MKKKILVTGLGGQVANELKVLFKSLDHKVFFTSKEILDITKKDQLRKFCEEKDIGIIINCAAYNKVDQAEVDKDLAKKINFLAVKELAKISKEFDISLIHLSTNYVFDGKKQTPYTEEDLVNPINFYGITKAKAEEAILKINPKNSVIIRTSWLYSKYRENFVKTMLDLSKKTDTISVVWDQLGSPTYAKDLASFIVFLVKNLNNKDVEIFHYANEGVTSWYDFTKHIFNFKNIEKNVLPVLSSEYKTKAKRPKYGVLDKSKIKKRFDIFIPYWMNSLKKCLDEI